jgi:hypothetical protein
LRWHKHLPLRDGAEDALHGAARHVLVTRANVRRPSRIDERRCLPSRARAIRATPRRRQTRSRCRRGARGGTRHGETAIAAAAVACVAGAAVNPVAFRGRQTRSRRREARAAVDSGSFHRALARRHAPPCRVSYLSQNLKFVWAPRAPLVRSSGSVGRYRRLRPRARASGAPRHHCLRVFIVLEVEPPKPSFLGQSQKLKFVGCLCPKTSSLWDASRTLLCVVRALRVRISPPRARAEALAVPRRRRNVRGGPGGAGGWTRRTEAAPAGGGLGYAALRLRRLPRALARWRAVPRRRETRSRCCSRQQSVGEPADR